MFSYFLGGFKNTFTKVSKSTEVQKKDNSKTEKSEPTAGEFKLVFFDWARLAVLQTTFFLVHHLSIFVIFMDFSFQFSKGLLFSFINWISFSFPFSN